jgi:hypothetical protein
MPVDNPKKEVESFQGLFSGYDPHDLEAGQASEQVNVYSPRMGELMTRPGIRVMTQEAE